LVLLPSGSILGTELGARLTEVRLRVPALALVCCVNALVVDSLVHGLSYFFILRIACTLHYGLLGHLVVFEHQRRQGWLPVVVSKLQLILKRWHLQLSVLNRPIEFEIFELVLVFEYQI
jgi:hypothetical protein